MKFAHKLNIYLTATLFFLGKPYYVFIVATYKMMIIFSFKCLNILITVSSKEKNKLNSRIVVNCENSYVVSFLNLESHGELWFGLYYRFHILHIMCL